MNKKQSNLWVVVIGVLLLVTHLALAGHPPKNLKVQKNKKEQNQNSSKELKKNLKGCEKDAESGVFLEQYISSSQSQFCFNKVYFVQSYQEIFFKTSIFFQIIYQTSVPVTTHILQIIKWLTLPNAP